MEEIHTIDILKKYENKVLLNEMCCNDFYKLIIKYLETKYEKIKWKNLLTKFNKYTNLNFWNEKLEINEIFSPSLEIFLWKIICSNKKLFELIINYVQFELNNKINFIKKLDDIILNHIIIYWEKNSKNNKINSSYIYELFSINKNRTINEFLDFDSFLLFIYPMFHEYKKEELDSKELDSKELDSKELDSKELDSKELDSKELDSKELDSKELDSKELDSKELDSKELDSKELDSKELDLEELDLEELEFKSASNMIITKVDKLETEIKILKDSQKDINSKINVFEKKMKNSINILETRIKELTDILIKLANKN